MEKEIFYRTIRQKYCDKLNSMPKDERINFLVQNHKKNMVFARKYGLKTLSLNEVENNEQKKH